MDRVKDIQLKPMNASAGMRKPSERFSAALLSNLALLGELYRQELTPLATIAYQEALRDLSIEAMNAGFKEAIKRCKFLPTPAEIRDEANIAMSLQERPREAAAECQLCRGTGWQLKPRDDGQGKWVIKCQCRGKQRVSV
jgi:hypothetical protein